MNASVSGHRCVPGGALAGSRTDLDARAAGAVAKQASILGVEHMVGPMRGRSGDGRARLLSYANVVSTMALVLAVGGGSALAAGSLAGHKPKPKPHLTLNGADKAYISAQIAAGHVAFATQASTATSATSATNATNATNATHATAADSANSAKIAANVYSANVRGDGSLLGSIPTGATSSRTAVGDYRVNLGRAITGCTIAVSLSNTAVQIGMVGVGVIDANTLQVFTRDGTNNPADLGFYVQAICPAS